MLGAVLPGVEHLQNIHPLVVHFPIALLPAAALLYVVAWPTGWMSCEWAALWLLVLAAIAAIIAATTGLYAEPGVMVSRSVRAHLLVPHRWAMLTFTGLTALAAGWGFAGRPFPIRARPVFVLLLLIAAAVMAVGADYGGRMVYDYNAGGNACPQPIEFSE